VHHFLLALLAFAFVRAGFDAVDDKLSIQNTKFLCETLQIHDFFVLAITFSEFFCYMITRPGD